MKSLSQFKEEENISTIDLMQGNGRMFATIREKSVIVSKECDLEKDLYVIPLTNAETGLVIPNAFVIINSNVKKVGSL